MLHIARWLLVLSFTSCILVTISESKSSSISSNEGSKLTGSSRLKRSPYLYPYRQDYHQYFIDESKREVDENAFDRKRRIAYYYPGQRSYNYVAFVDPENDSEDEMDRKRRSILTPYLPRYGNSPFMQMEDDSEDDNEGEVFKRRRRVVPYYFPRFGSGSYNRFLKRFAYFDEDDSDKKKKRSTDDQEEDDNDRKKRATKRNGNKRSLLLDDLANDDITSFGYDKRA